MNKSVENVNTMPENTPRSWKTPWAGKRKIYLILKA
jgi:hypothetical protein